MNKYWWKTHYDTLILGNLIDQQGKICKKEDESKLIRVFANQEALDPGKREKKESGEVTRSLLISTLVLAQTNLGR